MILDSRPYEYIAEFQNGSYTYRKATDEERKMLLEEYKKQQIKELEKQIDKIKQLV